MSEATERAYAASAEALKLNMLAYAADLLGLDPAIERVLADERHPFCVRIDPGIGESFPLMNVSLKEWRRRGPGSTTEVMVRAIGRLALARVWRRHGTVAPPAGLLVTNVVGRSLVERAGVDPQAFLDATWSPVELGDKYGDTSDWMSSTPSPALLARAAVATHRKRDLAAGLPWMSGYSSQDAVFVEAVAFGERIALHWRPQDRGRSELRILDPIPMTMAHALVGQPTKALVSHPVLNRLGLEIDGVRLHRRSTRVLLRGDAAWTRARFKGGNEVRRELADETKALKPGRRQLEELIVRHLGIPGHKGDISLTRDDALWLDDGLDDIDDMTGMPWPGPPEFEGIMTRRGRRDYHHDEGDPIIQFDEDDPASYV